MTGLVNAYYLGHLFQIRLTTPSKRQRYRNVLSRHYLDTSIKVYNLFSIPGPAQLFRTKRTTFWEFRRIKQHTYNRLIQDALTLL